MKDPDIIFNAIRSKLIDGHEEVSQGKMMSDSGLKYKDKVFAFYHKESMGFRLGPDFDPEQFGLKNFKFLSPLKKKPPLKGWFIIDKLESDTWEVLSEKALEFTVTLPDK